MSLADWLPKNTGVVYRIATPPSPLTRYRVIEPPPFGDGRPIEFESLADAFRYMAMRGYQLDEQVVKDMLDQEAREHRAAIERIVDLLPKPE